MVLAVIDLNVAGATMEQYAKSVQDVDAALNRLKATLASYKPFEKPSPGNSPVRGQAASPPPPAVTGPAAKSQPKIKDPGLIREKPQSQATGCWKCVLDLRSSHNLPQVCLQRS